MNLFDQYPEAPHNILPQDGTVYYYGKRMLQADAEFYFDKLMTDIAWRNDEAIMFGKVIVTKRKVAWYGDQSFEYTYSNITKKALPWTPELIALKQWAEQQSCATFNSCLLNLYHSGAEGMAWHSDGEKDLLRHGAIASISLGAERKFAFKHKATQQKIELLLEHGSLLIMTGATQEHWLHRLPPTTKIAKPRINLTFRTIVG